MPSVSRSQQRLMQAAEHGATFPKAKALRQSMSHAQLHDFAVGSEQSKPERVKKPAKMEHESYSYDWRSRNNLKQNTKRATPTPPPARGAY